jgi:acyl-CoA hydrolase
MNTEYETSFTVYPQHTNCHSPLIFGGAFFSEMDKAAATAVRRLLYDSDKCKSSVTHKYEGTFCKPCYLGDLIFLKAEIVSTGVKSVVVQVEAWREKEKHIRADGRELVATAKFVSVTISSDESVDEKPDLLPYAPHGIKL